MCLVLEEGFEHEHDFLIIGIKLSFLDAHQIDFEINVEYFLFELGLEAKIMQVDDLIDVFKRLSDDFYGREEDKGFNESEGFVVEEIGAEQVGNFGHDVLSVVFEIGVAGGLQG